MPHVSCPRLLPRRYAIGEGRALVTRSGFLPSCMRIASCSRCVPVHNNISNPGGFRLQLSSHDKRRQPSGRNALCSAGRSPPAVRYLSRHTQRCVCVRASMPCYNTFQLILVDTTIDTARQPHRTSLLHAPAWAVACANFRAHAAPRTAASPIPEALYASSRSFIAPQQQGSTVAGPCALHNGPGSCTQAQGRPPRLLNKPSNSPGVAPSVAWPPASDWCAPSPSLLLDSTTAAPQAHLRFPLFASTRACFPLRPGYCTVSPPPAFISPHPKRPCFPTPAAALAVRVRRHQGRRPSAPLLRTEDGQGQDGGLSCH